MTHFFLLVQIIHTLTFYNSQHSAAPETEHSCLSLSSLNSDSLQCVCKMSPLWLNPAVHCCVRCLPLLCLFVFSRHGICVTDIFKLKLLQEVPGCFVFGNVVPQGLLYLHACVSSLKGQQHQTQNKRNFITLHTRCRAPPL